MGSEMCIRDSRQGSMQACPGGLAGDPAGVQQQPGHPPGEQPVDCLLYTSDAADERSSVDLGGRRIIKKKKSACMLRARLEHVNNTIQNRRGCTRLG